MINWTIFKIGELCTRVTSGGTPLTSKKEYYLNGTIPWLKTTEIHKEIITETDTFITKEGLKNSSAKLIAANSIIVAMYGDGGTAGKVALTKIPLTTNQACCNLTINEQKADYRFVYYYLKANYSNLVNLKTGGSQQNLNGLIIKNITISIPTLSIQNTISTILTKYDESIEINSKRIKLLEETAREIYKEWFVRLRFPGYESIKLIKGVPENWEIKKVVSILNRRKFGKTYKADQLKNRGAVITIDQSTDALLGYHDNEPDHIATPDDPLIIFGDHTCKMQLMIEPFSLGENVIPFSSKDGMPIYFLFYLIESLVETTEYKRHWNELVTKHVFIPNQQLQNKYSGVVKPFFEQIETLKKQNIQLREIRDRLLPRLISGKLQVKLTADTSAIKILSANKIAPNDTAPTKTIKVNPYFKRRVLAAYIIDHLKNEVTFGHVKLMKLMYLCEHLAAIETVSNYHRDAAGPYDNKMMRSIDKQLRDAKWFDCIKADNKYIYHSMAKSGEHKEWFEKYYSEKKIGIDSLLSIFGKEKTEKAEMVATLYEAHRDLKSKYQIVSDSAIINEVLNNWHDSKKRIEEQRWSSCLKWMKEKEWIT